MRSTILSACGKAVQFMGIAHVKAVDVHPQNDATMFHVAVQAVYNPTFMPVLSVNYPHFYPQAFLAKIDLLEGMLSPLSTVPTIKTTNLKNQER